MPKNSREPDIFGVMLGVLNPALVMGLVGSLAFFMLDVGYRGQFSDQLRWTMFFFVFAIVLVSRISFTMGADRAAGYGVVLTAVTFLATTRFVEGISAALSFIIILVIAGSAYVLTKDTTRATTNDSTPQSLSESLTNVWHLTDQKRGRKVHGLWVMWYTIAALPIFGIGQSLIPVADIALRQTSFWRMTTYVACAFGLLLTTALVNLRRYLKTKKLKLPTSLAIRWLATGAAIVAVAMLIAACVPRPQSETPLFAFDAIGSPKRDANRVSFRGKTGGVGKSDRSGQHPEEKAESHGDGDGNHSDSKSGSNKQGERGAGGEKPAQGDKGNGKHGTQGDDQGTGDDNRSQETKPPPTQFDSIFASIQSLLRWFVVIIIILFVAFFILRVLANSRAWAASWWNKLMAWFRPLQASSPAEEIAVSIRHVGTPRPFHSFSNPFSDGTAEQRDPAELVRYSFAALEAWGRENGRARAQCETPLEFAHAVGAIDRELLAPAERLAALYSKQAYSSITSAKHQRAAVQALWQTMKHTSATT